MKKFCTTIVFMFIALSNGFHVNVNHIIGFDENKKILYIRPTRGLNNTFSTIVLKDEDVKNIKKAIEIFNND